MTVSVPQLAMISIRTAEDRDCGQFRATLDKKMPALVQEFVHLVQEMKSGGEKLLQ